MNTPNYPQPAYSSQMPIQQAPGQIASGGQMPSGQQSPILPYSPPSNAQDTKDTNILKMQIDVEDALQKFEFEVLRGMYLRVNTDTMEKEWVPIAPSYEPPCNEIGVREIMGRIRGRAHIIARVTYKEEDECYTDMFHFHMSISEMFTKRSDEWGMDEETAKPILDAALEIVEDIVFCARNGFTAMNLRTQYQEQRVNKDDGGAPATNFLGLKSGGRR